MTFTIHPLKTVMTVVFRNDGPGCMPETVWTTVPQAAVAVVTAPSKSAAIRAFGGRRDEFVARPVRPGPK